MKPIFQMEFDPACASYSPLRCELLHRLISALYAANSRSQAALEPEIDDDDPDDVYGRPQPEGPRGQLRVEPADDENGDPAAEGSESDGFHEVHLAALPQELRDFVDNELAPLCAVTPFEAGIHPGMRWAASRRQVTLWDYGVDLLGVDDWRVVAPLWHWVSDLPWVIVAEACFLEDSGDLYRQMIVVSVIDSTCMNKETDTFIRRVALASIPRAQ